MPSFSALLASTPQTSGLVAVGVSEVEASAAASLFEAALKDVQSEAQDTDKPEQDTAAAPTPSSLAFIAPVPMMIPSDVPQPPAAAEAQDNQTTLDLDGKDAALDVRGLSHSLTPDADAAGQFLPTSASLAADQTAQISQAPSADAGALAATSQAEATPNHTPAVTAGVETKVDEAVRSAAAAPLTSATANQASTLTSQLSPALGLAQGSGSERDGYDLSIRPLETSAVSAQTDSAKTPAENPEAQATATPQPTPTSATVSATPKPLDANLQALLTRPEVEAIASLTGTIVAAANDGSDAPSDLALSDDDLGLDLSSEQTPQTLPLKSAEATAPHLRLKAEALVQAPASDAGSAPEVAPTPPSTSKTEANPPSPLASALQAQLQAQAKTADTAPIASSVAAEGLGSASPFAGQLDLATPQSTPTTVSGSTLATATVETTALLSAQILRKLDGRSTRFDMTLTPESLGQVDVSLTIDSDGQVIARLAFDNPAAAADMRGRADELRRQLADAGLNLSQDNLEFAERNPQSGSGGGAFSRDPDRRAFAGANRLIQEADVAILPTAASWATSSQTPDRVDVKV